MSINNSNNTSAPTASPAKSTRPTINPLASVVGRPVDLPPIENANFAGGVAPARPAVVAPTITIPVTAVSPRGEKAEEDGETKAPSIDKDTKRVVRKARDAQSTWTIRTDKVELTIGDQKVMFPLHFLTHQADSAPRDVETYAKWTKLATRATKDTKAQIISKFLTELAKACTDGLSMARFISDVSTDHLELCIAALIDLKFKLPREFEACNPKLQGKKKVMGALNSSSDVIALLKERIAICLDEEFLVVLAKQYPWYIEASRRAVTLAHVSEKGLSGEVVKFIAHLCKNRPDLAFMLSPTTLHDNTLVDPRVARFFTCDPFARTQPFTDEPVGEYGQVVTDKTLEKHRPLVARLHGDRVLANMRIAVIMEPLRTNKGYFPWHHPTRRNTGVLLAGGLPGAVICSEEQWQAVLDAGTDVDLFVYGETDEDRKAMVELLLRHFEALGGKLEHFKSVFQIKGLGRDVQVICPYARSPLGVLINFDHTCIQIGYQEAYEPGIEYIYNAGMGKSEWFATPGHCFFTPRAQSFITRYNVRLFRMEKLLKRGFVPVSDNRGHLLYPHKTYFSPLWQLEIMDKAVYDARWIDDRARAGYSQKKFSHDERAKLLGNGTSEQRTEALRQLEIKDKKLWDKEVEYWTVQAKKNTEAEKTHVKVIDCRKLPPTLSPRTKTILVRSDGTEVDLSIEKSKIVQQDQVPGVKTEIEWVSVTADEAMATFHPEGATLSNGFDIYTQGVNATLPLPDDGETDDIYLQSFLLRNVRFVTPSASINLAAPQEKPLWKHRTPLSDPADEYPARYYRHGKDDAREIEGVFVFGFQRSEEEVEAEIAEKCAKEEARHAKIHAQRLEKARGILLNKCGVPEADITPEMLEEYVNQMRKLYNPYSDELRRPHLAKTLALTKNVDFKDLHSQLTEKNTLAVVDVWELPLLIQAFSQDKPYLSKRKRTIKKKDGMVRVRAPVSIADALVFDVDDLLAPLSSLDAFPGRRYNVVVRLMNLERWILKAHDHLDLVVEYGDSKILHELIQAKLADPEFNPLLKDDKMEHNGKLKVSDFLRAVRHVANLEKVEEECRKAICRLPHAHKGLPGHMPVIFCTRFYVSKHNASSTLSKK